MSLSDISDRLKQIDIKSKLIVNGFIRESQYLLPVDDNPYYNLNELIIRICLIYYAIVECWAVLHNSFISKENGIVLRRETGRERWENANYGKMTIPSIGEYIYEWRIKIGKLRNTALLLGVCDSKCNVMNQGVKWLDCHRYIYSANAGTITTLPRRRIQGNRLQGWNIVLIRVDSKKGRIGFYEALNENEKMELSEEIDLMQKEDLSYRLAASLFYNGDYITITDFQMLQA